MIKNTYYKVMNERDDVFATTETRREAKTIASLTAEGYFSQTRHGTNVAILVRW